MGRQFTLCRPIFLRVNGSTSRPSIDMSICRPAFHTSVVFDETRRDNHQGIEKWLLSPMACAHMRGSFVLVGVVFIYLFVHVFEKLVFFLVFL